MISNNIQKGTIVVHPEYGQGIFKCWGSEFRDRCIVEFEDDVFEVPREQLTEVE